MYTFTSVNNRFSIYGAPINGVPEFMVNFNPVGSMGNFSTNDEELALKLRQHPEFGKKFMEIGITGRENPIVQGVRSSESHPELGKEPLNKEKLIELGRLQATLLKNDGTYRKDATEEQIKRYELLKSELEN